MLNYREEYELLHKSLSLTTNGGGNLEPLVLSRALTEYVKILPNIRNFIKRESWPTFTASGNYQGTVGSAVSYAESAVIPFSDSSYGRWTQNLSNFARLFQISNQAIRGSQPYIDIVTEELMTATKQIMRVEDQAIIQGDSVQGSPGLLVAATASQPTSAVGGSGLTLTQLLLDQVEAYQNEQGYEVDAWFVSRGVWNVIRNAAYNAVRATNIDLNGVATIGFSGGPQKAMLYNGKPVIMDKYMRVNNTENVLAVSLDAKDLITYVNLEPEVEDFTYATPQYDGRTFRVKEYCTTVLKNPYSAVALTNVTLPAANGFLSNPA